MRGLAQLNGRGRPSGLRRRGGGRKRSSFLPTLFCGFGTAFVGKRDFWPDGSYVTTEWVMAFYVPLGALRSVRLKKNPRRFSEPGNWLVYPFISHGTSFTVYDETRPQGKQVLCVYGFVVCYAAWVVGLLVLLQPLAKTMSDVAATALILAIVALPWVVPLYVRQRAKHWRPGFK